MLLRRITKHVKDQNWFAVALDFLIVVVGVGVAMLGQQWISDRQQRADMGVAERALQTDLVLNYSSATERLAVADCRTETYQAIATQLLLPGERWDGVQVRKNEEIFPSALPNILRSPSRPWGSLVWDAELIRGTFNQMDNGRRAALGRLFDQTSRAQVLQTEIYTLQGRLKVLAVAKSMTQSEKLRYYELLGELDDKSSLLEVYSAQTVQQIKNIGIELEPALAENVSQNLDSANARLREIYGDCAKPLDWSVYDKYLNASVAQ